MATFKTGGGGGWFWKLLIIVAAIAAVLLFAIPHMPLQLVITILFWGAVVIFLWKFVWKVFLRNMWGMQPRIVVTFLVIWVLLAWLIHWLLLTLPVSGPPTLFHHGILARAYQWTLEQAQAYTATMQPNEAPAALTAGSITLLIEGVAAGAAHVWLLPLLVAFPFTLGMMVLLKKVRLP